MANASFSFVPAPSALATSTWAENLQVTLVGVAAGLPDAVGSGRVRHVDDVDALMEALEELRSEAAA